MYTDPLSPLDSLTKEQWREVAVFHENECFKLEGQKKKLVGLIENLAEDINTWEKGLSSIQWITSNQKFNPHQHVQIGDAIASFYDCISSFKQMKELTEALGK